MDGIVDPLNVLLALDELTGIAEDCVKIAQVGKRHLPQAKVLGGVCAYLAILTKGGYDLSLEVWSELELMCTVSVARC